MSLARCGLDEPWGFYIFLFLVWPPSSQDGHGSFLVMFRTRVEENSSSSSNSSRPKQRSPSPPRFGNETAVGQTIPGLAHTQSGNSTRKRFVQHVKRGTCQKRRWRWWIYVPCRPNIPARFAFDGSSFFPPFCILWLLLAPLVMTTNK